MAIQINKNITTREGNNLTSYYGRLTPRETDSNVIEKCELSFYSDKTAWENGYSTIAPSLELTLDNCALPLDATWMQVLHDKVKQSMIDSGNYLESELTIDIS